LFTFNSAFEPKLDAKVGQLWNNSDCDVLVIFTGQEALEKLGFKGLKCEGSVPVKMTGSGEGKTAWFYTHTGRNVIGQKRSRAEADVGVLPAAEAKIKRAMDIATSGDRDAFLTYTDDVFEKGLRTSVKVLEKGKVVKRSIRIKTAGKRYSTSR
jgi:hypothetical protein